MDKKETKKRTVLSMFSGCGGMDLGFMKAGFQILWANDLDLDACATYRKNVGEIHEGNIRNLEIPKVSQLDVLCSGFPCQAYSNAGSRNGIKDHRGQLYQYSLDYIEVLKPKIIIFENVRGFLSIHGEKKPLVEEIADELVRLGYEVYINLVNAADYGVPQNRLRTFIVGVSKKSGIPRFSFPPKVKGRDLSIGSAILDIPADAPNQTDLLALNPQAVWLGKMVPEGGSWKDIPYENLPPRLKFIRDNMRKYRWPNFYRRFHRSEVSGTITAAFKPENAAVWHPIEDRVLSVREVATIQTFPKDFVFVARTIKAMYQMIGNAVPPVLGKAFAISIKDSLAGRAISSPKLNYFDVKSKKAPIRPGNPEMIYEPPFQLKFPLRGEQICISARI